MESQVFVVFSSSAGSIRRVAEVISAGFSQRKVDYEVVDLGRQKDGSLVLEPIQRTGKRTCLSVGLRVLF